MVFSFAIACAPVYTAIANYEIRVLNTFGVGVVFNSANYFLSTWGAEWLICSLIFSRIGVS